MLKSFIVFSALLMPTYAFAGSEGQSFSMANLIIVFLITCLVLAVVVQFVFYLKHVNRTTPQESLSSGLPKIRFKSPRTLLDSLICQFRSVRTHSR